MSYRLQADEPLSHGVRRIAREQIDDALGHLYSSGNDLDRRVHESRKCFKKVRGLLRLVRKEIGESVYHKENRCFRDAGRLLSDLRDSVVRIQTVDSLWPAYQEAATNTEMNALTAMHDTLVIFYQATRHRVVNEENALAEAAAAISGARQRVDSWPLEENSFGALAGGLRKIYKRGRNRLAGSSDAAAAETLHEWRKRVKYLWYSTRILRPIWPEPMAALAIEIHQLSDFLGDDHDLADMAALVEMEPLIVNTAARSRFFSVVGQKRAELQLQAFQKGKHIYAELPDQFMSRMAAYWDVAFSRVHDVIEPGPVHVLEGHLDGTH